MKPLNPLLHRLCALIMLHIALTGVSSASHQHPYWSENLSNKFVMSAVLLLFAVLQPVLSPQGRQCRWWNFPSFHLLTEPSFYIGLGTQQASECFWALLSHKPSSVRAVWRRHLEHSAPCLSYTLGLDKPSPWPPAHHSANSSLLQCCTTSDLQHHYPEVSGGIPLFWK